MMRSGQPAAMLAGLVLGLSSSVVRGGEDGGQLYAANCAVCHMADGAGSPGLAPPLRSPLWQRLGPQATSYVAGVMVSGLVGVPLDGTRYYAAMPPWLQLTDAQLAAIGNYILGEINGDEARMDAAIVQQARAASPSYSQLAALRNGGG